ncbi:glycerol-3-phosphate dehydrogenase/oxidase [Paracoccus sp. Z330]|uniref:Glycerol-3-phosphate dehydrogenase/oxidase n=1 Tax=Paracoccus onchidii TaxID=3017813 RepID=A0ABT4ZAJ3_9RHOB|nr:glycerol-3-phosphate dehydrogenase/oxidase [Paracoccus onchidii]MDB6176369.1 glycerol-3-phosphate dehydrogenase/oxidase [Paracoccus onchidii]
MSEIRDLDVLIIGAGINGAGLFRDLCEQGLNCVITDKGDFGGGTSSAPSRLIHGGIKYLETAELGLVSQSTLERNLLLKNAPHLVKPLPTVIPIFSWLKGIPAALRTLIGSTTAPRSRGAVLMKIGMMMYDFYGRRHRVMPRHQIWSKARALKEIPPLTSRIVAAGQYYDATVTQPERLVWELVADGLRANTDATALNYTHIAATDGEIIHLATPEGKIALRPRVVVNAAGPWIDRVNAQLGASSHLIGGTKGSHILLDHPELIRALKGRMIYFEADDGRICLVFDYLGRALVGSTDIRADDPDKVRCEDHEVTYFMSALRSLLPGLSFDDSQIVYAYSGIRPLPASDGTAPGLISRDHSAPVAPRDADRQWPIISLVGGKWTTFRGFSEEVADMVLDLIESKRLISTQNLPIGGGRDLPAQDQRENWIARLSQATGAHPKRIDQLLSRYGSTAAQIAAAEGETPVMLEDAIDFSHAELAWITGHEQVRDLQDLVMRRTPLAVTGSLSIRDINNISIICANILKWDDRQRQDQLDRTIEHLDSRHRTGIARR